MSILSDLERTISKNQFLAIVVAAAVIYGLYVYSEQKGFYSDPFDGANPTRERKVGFAQQAPPVVQGSGAAGPTSIDPMTGQGGVPAGSANMPVANPSDLLPRDTNNQWGSLNPAGSGDLTNQNLLSATFLTGIDTIGNTMKNANLQLRSEPPNPQLNVGPWNQSTFAPDLMRTPLEIGVGSQ
jgi:hypothetical protein